MTNSAWWSAGIADPRRIQAVERAGLVNGPAEDAFDRLTELAAMATKTRRACITVVDADHYRYKSTVGVPEGSVHPGPVEESFCRYVVGSSRPFYVTDASADPRTVDHPAIELHGIGAWAGYPIEDEDGWVLGTFCLIDDKPRVWTDSDLSILATLAAVTSSEIALRRLRAIIASTVISPSALASDLESAASHQELDEVGRTRRLRRLSQAVVDIDRRNPENTIR
ncbi:MAG TPA: GAF domain-containing protein [Aquihabitans sp.]|jgi:GAF domain-containing protein|nr:GAF domain-containing protein [Aquihabitans sp.]